MQASEGGYIDPYPNWFIESFSLWYQDGENALGAPDNEVATIYQDYGNGYITFDFGRNQEIINGTGSDFMVYTQGGNYIIRVGNDLNQPFEILENATGGVLFNGNQSFDLTGTNLAMARYVLVECSSPMNVELDAIEAVNYYQPIPESTPPQIIDFSPEELWVWSDQSSVQVSWEVDDFNPWNYSILVDDELVDQGLWMDDSTIEYTLGLSDKSESVEITIILDDLFGNTKEEIYVIEIRNRPPETSYIDPYPNWFIESFSLWYQDGENALGAPDNEVATIYQDYGNGYITFDFGRNQEIINGASSDFMVYAQGGNYIIRIGNDLSQPFEILENATGGVTFHGNQSFDLTETDQTMVRFVQVEASSLMNVELDAIEALNYFEPTPETSLPQIVDFSPDQSWVWSNQSSVQVSWEVDDSNPWNYSILVDDELVEQGLWMDDSIIEYTLSLSGKTDSVEMLLLLDDLFGNRKADSVVIEIRTLSSENGKSTFFPTIPFLVGIVFISALKIWRRKENKK